MSTISKTCVIFSSMPAAISTQIYQIVRRLGYSVPLHVVSLAQAPFLTTGKPAGVGNIVAGLYDDLEDPPAILCVTRTSQVVATYTAINPDLCIVLGYAYPITSAILSMRAPVINCHPAPLPALRGGWPFYMPILSPHEYPLSQYVATFILMDTGMDTGNILKEVNVGYGDDDHSRLTWSDLSTRAVDMTIQALEDVVRSVEKGYRGTPQRGPEPDTAHNGTNGENGSNGHDGGKIAKLTPMPGSPPSDQLRTIIPSLMTLDRVDALCRALCRSQYPPFLKLGDDLFIVDRLVSTDRDPEAIEGSGLTVIGDWKRVGLTMMARAKDGIMTITFRKL